MTEARKGCRLVCDMPDAGPWRLMVWFGEVYAFSQISGPWVLRNDQLERVDVSQAPGAYKPQAFWVCFQKDIV